MPVTSTRAAKDAGLLAQFQDDFFAIGRIQSLIIGTKELCIQVFDQASCQLEGNVACCQPINQHA